MGTLTGWHARETLEGGFPPYSFPSSLRVSKHPIVDYGGYNHIEWCSRGMKTRAMALNKEETKIRKAPTSWQRRTSLLKVRPGTIIKSTITQAKSNKR